MQYANNFVQKLGMGDPSTCVYQIIYDEKGKNDTHIAQNFIMHRLVLCIKVDIYVIHLFICCRSVIIHQLQSIKIRTNNSSP